MARNVGPGQLKSFLNSQILARAEDLLLPPLHAPDGEILKTKDIPADGQKSWSCFVVCQFLEEQLLKKLSQDPLFREARPVLLGSLARHEICPQSDIDLLFLGNDETVGEVVSKQLAEGLRVRSRLPMNSENWAQGVEFQDVLSLFYARAFDSQDSYLLEKQKRKIFTKVRRRNLVKKLFRERLERNRRFDSISNYLEPNMKYGGGGLRDLEQGLMVMDLFPEIFSSFIYEKRVLQYYKGFFLTLRQKLAFAGYGDILIGSEQQSLSEWFGYQDVKEFMRQIQRGISRVSFYSDWVLEQALKEKKWDPKKYPLKKPEQLLQLLVKDPNLQNQYIVRRSLRTAFGKAVSVRRKGKLIEKIFLPPTKDQSVVAVFRSRLIDDLCPRFRRLVGYVQLDQYHRLTADAHLLQAVREVRRLFLFPRELGRLSFLKKDLQKKDLRILQWAALYHDLAKGSNEDHSEKGEQWVFQDLKAYGVEKEIIIEVAWLVKNHLALSQAAFRKNPQDPQTWEELFRLGTTDQRLRRLALFTAADIRATNAEAWNAWKSELLAKVVKNWLQGRTQNFLQVKMHLPESLKHLSLENWDLQLFEVFSAKIIVEDLQKLSTERKPSVRLFKDKAKRTWVRFYTPEDQSGLLLRYLSLLYSFGCSVQHALVHTAEGFGVYDWFQISSSRSPALLEKYLAAETSTVPVEIPQVQFMAIDLVSENPQEWVIGFRGSDQKGCLLAATARITELGGEILSARVHTWGRQIDDLFHIRPRPENSADFLLKLRENLL